MKFQFKINDQVRLKPQLAFHPKLAGPWTGKTAALKERMEAAHRASSTVLTVTGFGYNTINLSDGTAVFQHMIERV